MTVLMVVIVGFICFCNGAIVALVETRREAAETPFFMEWEKEVNESQTTIGGKLSMKAFYFVPTIVAVISKKKSH